MRLDNTRVVVRERGYLELLDLALCLIRAHLGLLAAYALAGIVPFALLNWLLLRPYDANLHLEFAEVPEWSYLWRVTYLTLLAMPIATAPLTLCLSKVMFHDRPTPGEIFRDFMRSLPQLVLVRTLLWGLLILPAVFLDDEAITSLATMVLMLLFFLRFFLRPYTGEIILLEQNPLTARNSLQMTTGKRAQNLHGPHQADLFSRWAMSLLFSVPWLIAMWLSTWTLQGLLFSGSTSLAPAAYSVAYPVCLWLVIAFFTVVRFLSYLDLRIRGEGWEVELRLRAAGEQLTRRLA
ncbi:MAG: hypothetical protein AB7O62_11305 [Pirellulales bacterium]